MRLFIAESVDQMARAAAKQAAGILKDAIRQKGSANFIVATGASQFDFLKYLVAEPDLDWNATTMFHLDEYIGFSADHPASFRRYLRERLTSRVPIGTVNFVRGDAPDVQAELERLNRLLRATAIDAAFVGIGENGHLAFNDPPADFQTETPFIIVNLDDACRRQQFGEGWFKSLDDVPTRAISMSVKEIMRSGHIICTVPDKRKSAAVKNCLERDVNPQYPASILRTHPQCSLFLDRDAASQLSPATRALATRGM